MQKYFVKVLQGCPLKTCNNIFVKYRHFSYSTKDFFSSSKSSISGFCCCSKNIYIFVALKKNFHKIERPQTAQGGGVKALADASAKNAIFFDVLPNALMALTLRK